jgi:hypothetical protein
MPTRIVPCRPGSRGGVPVRLAYAGDPLFCRWRDAADASGEPWYVLSTEHGLLHPDDVLPSGYDRGIGEALEDEAMHARLRDHFQTLGLGPDDVVVVGADWFQDLVARALRVPKERIALRDRSW